MVVGFVLGIFRMLVDTPVTMKLAGFEHGYTPGTFLWIVNNIFFQYFSVLICLVCIVVMIVVSYVTQPPSEEQIRGLTFGTVTKEQRRQSRSSWSWHEVVASVLIVAAIVGAYLYFTG